MTTLTADEVRRIAASAPFAAAPAADAGAVLRELGALQLDPMSRVERAHRLTALARMRAPRSGRIGAPAEVDAALWGPGEASVFEGVHHALCVLPVESWPLQRERHEAWARRLDDDDDLLAEWRRVERLVGESPAGLVLGDLELAEARTTGWDYSSTKQVVELAVGAGRLVVTERRAGQRILDLPERRIPPALREARLDADEIADARIARAVRVLGIGTTAELARHARLDAARAEAALERLAAAGEAVPVTGDAPAQWASAAALAASGERAPSAVRWLGPFDNLMWDRERIARIFGLDYRLEAYVPKAKRVHGPYALVALAGDRMVGRIDLRADRRAGALHVEGFVPQPGRPPLARLRAALPGFARSLGLAEVRGLERVGAA
ncbi:MAG: winged helix-turn-helix domain-containing protein [Microbacteriaceae bacterium]|nr:winged helix-turn-helix domain-containing protein [Microbacteriaceae bacterium]